MTDEQRAAYVRAALLLQGYELDEPRIAAVLREFTRIQAVAATIVDRELPFELDPAPLFRP
jgi:hypothetical protein